MKENDDYILSVGTKAENRLTKLSNMLEPTTKSHLLAMGIKEGNAILEVGCGAGHVTEILSELTGESGRVFSIDTSIEQINVAKERMKSKGIKNVEFHHQSIIEELSLDSEFDVAYSRLALMHTTNFPIALRNMYKSIKPGRVIGCEEASNAHYLHYPFSPAYDKSRVLLVELSKLKGLDPYIGDKLLIEISKLGVKNIKTKVFHPIYQMSEERRIVLQFFDEIKNKFIEYGLATCNDIAELRSEIEEFVSRDDAFITFPAITQIYATKI